jgi:hypothetical protein
VLLSCELYSVNATCSKRDLEYDYSKNLSKSLIKKLNGSLDAEDLDVEADIVIKPVAVNKKFKTTNNMSSIGTVSYDEGINLDNKKYLLYPTFNDPQKAFQNVKVYCKNALDYLQENYNLDSLNNDNYSEYFNCTSLIIVEGNIRSDVLLKEIMDLDEFLNTYENTFLNNEIISEVENLDGTFDDTTLEDSVSAIENIKLMAPYNTGIAEGLDETKEDILEDVSEKYDISISNLEDLCDNEDISNNTLTNVTYTYNSNFNVSKGVSYANKYAASPNKSYRDFGRGDCTNFVSQIKKAGGVKAYYRYKTTGSNVRVDTPNSWFYSSYYNYGQIWTVADKFAKFFGVKSTTTSFPTFSKKVKKGSFIGYSQYGDGKWNHIAFVTGKSTNKKTTSGVTYYDFKVAQHSDDYNLWVSNSNNGWEKLRQKYSNLKFGIIY